MPLAARGLCAALVAVVLLAAGSAGAAAPAGQVVRFATADGVTLAGSTFGDGTAGVVLAHMFPTDQTSWHPFARQLAMEGYRALAFDFRGYGRSSGARRIDEIDLDVSAAAGGPKTLHVYPGSVHGTLIFDSSRGPDLTGRMLVFVARTVRPR